MADDRKREPLAYRPTKRAVVRELVSLACLACVLATASIYWHYRLPTPLAPTTPLAPKPRGPAGDAWFDALLSHQLDGGAASAYELADGEAYDGPLSSYFSEANAMLTMQHLSEGIGYRVVGTQKHVDAEVWLEDVLRRYEGTHATGGSEYATHVEVFRQQSDGRHRFEILGHPVWKRYYGMSNLIVRISDGSEESKAHTLLVNAHIDSTIPSPGAVDDAAGVAIMLEALRALIAGRVSALIGHSGVGKSTLVNRIVPDARRETGAVSGVGKGRHTSTQSVAFEVPGGGWIIDTPGIRSFGLAHVSPDEIVGVFPDLAEAAERCPRGCTHLGPPADPECAWDDLDPDSPVGRRSRAVRGLLEALHSNNEWELKQLDEER